MIIIKGIFIVRICHTRWECKALYKNTDNAHVHTDTHTHTHTHTHWTGIGTAVKKNEVIEQVRLECSPKRGGTTQFDYPV